MRPLVVTSRETSIWSACVLAEVRLKSRAGNIPPPNGVPGCGAFRMAKPGV